MALIRIGALTALVIFLAVSAEAAPYANVEEALEAGDEHLFMWRIGEAEVAFAAAGHMAQTDQERILARLGQGHVLYFSGRYDEARAVYDQVLAMPRLQQDEAFFANQYTGHCFVQQGEFKRAMDAYRGCLGARPSLVSNAVNDMTFAGIEAVNEGRRLLRLGQYGQARAALDAALALDGLHVPEQREAWLLRGDCMTAAEETEEAIRCWQQALDAPTVAPDGWMDARALARIARLHEERGEAEEARAAWRRLLDVDDPHPNLRVEAVERLGRLSDPRAEEADRADASYGAEHNPTGSPVGGGAGYADVFVGGDVEVATAEDLEAALKGLAARTPDERRGKVVTIAPRAEINMRGHTNLRIPSGVTLAGDRGRDGAPGPLLYSDGPLKGYALFFVEEDARLTGLRLRGDGLTFSEMFGMWPDFFPNDFWETEGRTRPTILAVAASDGARIDNCEISQFAVGVRVHGPDVRVHHNHFHDVSPYPVTVSRAARRALIEANLIDWAWHAVATTDDMAASFVVRYNVFRETAPNLWGQGMSGQFAVDHHGRGEWFVVHHNTFLHIDPNKGVTNRSVVLAPPWDIARIHHNWFRDYMTADKAETWGNVRRYEAITDLRTILTRRDLSRHMKEFLDAVEDIGAFDMREIVAMTRAGVGGQNMWIYDNAYGREREVLPVTLFTTPRIEWITPVHRQVRTTAAGGRGGRTNAVLKHLSGDVPLDVDVETLHGLELKRVTIDFVTPNVENLRTRRASYVNYAYVPAEGEARRMYDGPAAPRPGEIVLNTRDVPNGLYGLIVTAEDDRGIKAEFATWFGIVNPAP